jgi:2-succinyl-6-hydroxy-2,4-cyclohexadiene-1-carboxylate synthase
MAADWREFAKHLAQLKTSTRAVDLWRFLECQPMPLTDFGKALNADASGQIFRGSGRALVGYSMGGRLALHALLEKPHPWQSAVIIGAHPGLESSAERESRSGQDATWASKALLSHWQQFLTEWDAQPLLTSTHTRDTATTQSMMLRRREIARSFVDWSLGTQQPLWDRLPEITIPVLWIVGDKDAKFRAIAERAVQQLPHATLAIAPNSGHRVLSDAPEWLASTVAKFLQTGR